MGHQARPDLQLRRLRRRDGYQGEAASAYALVVRTRAGGVEQVATWKALPGRTMRLTGATATGRTDITTVEVRTADGRVVLTLAV